MEKLLTVDEAAAVLRLHPQTVRRQLRTGQLRGIKRPGAKLWRVPESALMHEVTPREPEIDQLKRALEMVQARDARNGKVKVAPPGQDAISLLKELRQSRIGSLAGVIEDSETS